MAPRYAGALDQGTTSTRFILFDRGGLPVAMSQLEHAQHYPGPGLVEHDAQEIWEAARIVIARAMGQAGARAEDIAAIGVTNQRETLVVWDRASGRPLRRAIVWQDTRSAAICTALAREGGQDRFRARTGLPLATYFTGPKLQWVLEEEPAVARELRAGRALAGTIDSWLIWNLTGGPSGGAHVTDHTNASRTMLYSLAAGDWDPGLLATFGVPRECLPRIVASSEGATYGSTRKEGPLGGEVPVAGDLGDQQAALFGQACFAPGDAKNTYGTGCFLLLHTGAEPVISRNGLITTVAAQVAGEGRTFALEGSVAIAGALVQWVRDKLGLIKEAADIDALALSVGDSGGVYFVPAFSGLYAPYWRSDARGTIVGLTHYAGAGHLARAVLEATAFQTREVLDAMEKDSGVALARLKVDGGMTRSEPLMGFQADILGKPVVRPRVAETTALGAAYAAGLAVGFWKDRAELERNWAVDRVWESRMPAAEREARLRLWRKAVEKSLDWGER